MSGYVMHFLFSHSLSLSLFLLVSLSLSHPPKAFTNKTNSQFGLGLYTHICACITFYTVNQCRKKVHSEHSFIHISYSLSCAHCITFSEIPSRKWKLFSFCNQEEARNINPHYVDNAYKLVINFLFLGSFLFSFCCCCCSFFPPIRRCPLL